MKQHNYFILSLLSILMCGILFFAGCDNNKNSDPYASGIVGTWYNEGMGDADDVVKALMTINEDGTMAINAISSVDIPDMPDDVIKMVWSVEEDVLKIGFRGIEQEDEMDEQDYESFKFKLGNNQLSLYSDDTWHVFTKIK